MEERVRFVTVQVTCPSEAEARKLSMSLVEESLAACVNIIPVHSIYSWKGKICSDGEWLLVIKTQLARFLALEERIKELHPYDTPEIIALPILAGSEQYLKWLAASTGA